MDKYYIFLLFFSNNSSNSKNLIWLLKIQAEPRFRLKYFQFERDCKGRKDFWFSKHFSVFFNFHLGKNSLLNYRWFRLAGANVATFSFPPNFSALFFHFFWLFLGAQTVNNLISATYKQYNLRSHLIQPLDIDYQCITIKL